MLDLCGYVAGEDLARRVAVEPSCGDGAFLLPMIARLSASPRERGGALAEAKGAIRAFDLQEQHVEHARAAARDLLGIADFLFAFRRNSPWLAVALVTLGALAVGTIFFWTIVMLIAAIALIVLFVLSARRGSLVADRPAG